MPVRIPRAAPVVATTHLHAPLLDPLGAGDDILIRIVMRALDAEPPR